MWSLSLPDIDDRENIITKALTYHNGAPKYSLTNDELQIILQIYDHYDILKGSAHPNLTGETLGINSRQALYNAYSEVQENGRLSDYRSKLLLSAERCPCCSIGAADELDHHLPRSIYQPLSLYARNLIPMCHKCNNKKRAVNSTNPDNSFIHSYFEPIPLDKKFLIANIEIVEANRLVSTFEIIKIPELSDSTYRMLKFQCERINLNNRLQSEVNIFLTPLLVIMEEYFEEDENGARVKKYLEKQEAKFTKRMGLNDWRTSLLHSLSNNEEFCNGGFLAIV